MYFHLHGYRLIIRCLRDDLTALQEPFSHLVGMHMCREFKWGNSSEDLDYPPCMGSHYHPRVCQWSRVQGCWSQLVLGSLNQAKLLDIVCKLLCIPGMVSFLSLAWGGVFDHCPGLWSPSAGGALDVVRPFRLQPINRAAVNHIEVESLYGHIVLIWRGFSRAQKLLRQCVRRTHMIVYRWVMVSLVLSALHAHFPL